MPGYEYDVFISYSRELAVARWVREVLEPEVRQWLPQHVPHEPRVFRDERSVEPGTPWPDAIAHALLTSKLMLAVWSPGFFRSDWCMSEWQTMRERERRLDQAPGFRTGLVYPLRFTDGDHFDPEARDIQWVDVYEFSALEQAFRTTPDYLACRKRIQGICEQLGARILDCPAHDPSWPSLRRPGLETPEIGLARM